MRSIYQHVNACVRSVHAVSLPGYLCHAFASEGVRQRERKITFSAETASQSSGTSVVKLLWRNLRPTLRLYKGVTSRNAKYERMSALTDRPLDFCIRDNGREE